MAKIRIIGRSEEITVDNEKARKIKSRWLGDESKGIPKAEKGDLLDLGDWSGTYGSIRSIELDRWHQPNAPLNEGEVKQLAEDLKAYEQKRIKGRLYSPFELYCEARGLTRIDPLAGVLVLEPAGYTHVINLMVELDKKKGRVEFAKKKDLESLAATAPEEAHDPTPAPKRTCIMCPNSPNPPRGWYCSGVCLRRAKVEGVYGHEQEKLERAEALKNLD